MHAPPMLTPTMIPISWLLDCGAAEIKSSNIKIPLKVHVCAMLSSEFSIALLYQVIRLFKFHSLNSEYVQSSYF